MKTIHIKGTVAYPIYIDQDLKISDEDTTETIKSKVIDIAEQFLNDGCVKPIFQTELEITKISNR